MERNKIIAGTDHKETKLGMVVDNDDRVKWLQNLIEKTKMEQEKDAAISGQ